MSARGRVNWPFVGAQSSKKECGQCPHFLPRSGEFTHRIVSDSACSRDFPVLSRTRIPFESHLGHDVFPRQRRFCFDVLTKLVVASSDELVAGCGLGAAGPVQVCRVAGSSPWPVGLPPAVVGLYGSSFRSFGLVVGGQHLFMVPGDGYDMTTPTLVRFCCKSSLYVPFRR